MNTVHILGRLGKDPEIKTFDWGKVANFTIATTEHYKTKDGEKKEATEWHNVSCRMGLADFAAKWLKKGNRCLVTGKIASREYEKDGVKHRVYEIQAQSITPVDWPEKTDRPEKEPEVVAAEEVEMDDLPF